VSGEALQGPAGPAARPPIAVPVALLLALTLGASVLALASDSFSPLQRGMLALVAAASLASASGYLLLLAPMARPWLRLAAVGGIPLSIFLASGALMSWQVKAPGPPAPRAAVDPGIEADAPPGEGPAPSTQAADRLARAQAALERGEAGNAQMLFREARALLDDADPSHQMHALVGAAHAALMLSDHEAARIDLEAALKLQLDPAAQAQICAELGNLESLAGNPAAAKQHLARALELAERAGDAIGVANALLRRGELEARMHDHAAARRSLLEAARRYQELGQPSGRAHALLGLVELDLAAADAESAARNLQLAAQIYDAAQDLRGQASVQRLRATLEQARGESAHAQQSYAKAAELFERTGDEEAAAQFKQQAALLEAAAAPSPARRTDGARARAQRLWRQGYALYQSGDSQRAEARYRAAIAADPGYAPPHNSLGRLLMDGAGSDAAQLAKAREHIEIALRQRPGYMPAINNLGVIELRLKNHDAAIALFLQAERLAPGDALPLENLARAYLAAGHYQDAERIAERLAHVDAAAAKAIEARLTRALESAPRYPVAAESLRKRRAQAPAASKTSAPK